VVRAGDLSGQNTGAALPIPDFCNVDSTEPSLDDQNMEASQALSSEARPPLKVAVRQEGQTISIS
jgi:hypothetical protein